MDEVNVCGVPKNSSRSMWCRARTAGLWRTRMTRARLCPQLTGKFEALEGNNQDRCCEIIHECLKGLRRHSVHVMQEEFDKMLACIVCRKIGSQLHLTEAVSDLMPPESRRFRDRQDGKAGRRDGRNAHIIVENCDQVSNCEWRLEE